MNKQASSANLAENEKKTQLGEKKIRKSWKSSLFSWWKVHKKTKPDMDIEPANTNHISWPRKGHVSGPIYSSGIGGDRKLRRTTSGSITSISSLFNFNSSRRVAEDDIDIPYMCLDQISSSNHVKSYGPVYLVT